MRFKITKDINGTTRWIPATEEDIAEEQNEQYLNDTFANQREWVHDLILDVLANEYWLPEFRGLDAETVGERVLDVVKQVEDYLLDKRG